MLSDKVFPCNEILLKEFVRKQKGMRRFSPMLRWQLDPISWSRSWRFTKDCQQGTLYIRRLGTVRTWSILISFCLRKRKIYFPLKGVPFFFCLEEEEMGRNWGRGHAHPPNANKNRTAESVFVCGSLRNFNYV